MVLKSRNESSDKAKAARRKELEPEPAYSQQEQRIIELEDEFAKQEIVDHRYRNEIRTGFQGG